MFWLESEYFAKQLEITPPPFQTRRVGYYIIKYLIISSALILGVDYIVNTYFIISSHGWIKPNLHS